MRLLVAGKVGFVPSFVSTLVANKGVNLLLIMQITVPRNVRVFGADEAPATKWAFRAEVYLGADALEGLDDDFV